MYSFTKNQILSDEAIIFNVFELLYNLVTFQTIKENIRNKHIRISTRVSVVLIPTRTELESCDLWWSSNIYYNNQSYINMLQRKMINDFPSITKKDLKAKIMIELSKE